MFLQLEQYNPFSFEVNHIKFEVNHIKFEVNCIKFEVNCIKFEVNHTIFEVTFYITMLYSWLYEIQHTTKIKNKKKEKIGF